MSASDDDSTDDRSTRDVLGDILEDASATTNLVDSFYRAEIDRTTSWRTRLDQTTNWAVVLVAAILTWAFTSEDNPHYVILIGVFAVTAFLLIEAHRYREYDVWRQRVRVLQRHVFVPIFTGQPPNDEDWQADLGENLVAPTFSMSFREAVTHRLRRTFLALMLILLAAWIARITVFETDETWLESASIPGVSGAVVVGIVGAFYAMMIALAVWSARGEETREFEK
jgi:uncharacterized membrane protein